MEFRGLIGKPYEEPFGCFLLVRDFVWQNFRVQVPDYSETVSPEQKADALMRYLDEHAYPVSDPEPGDIVLLQWAGQPSHMGIYFRDGEMIHSFRDQGAHIESLNGIRWKRRVMGYWRVRR